ncbi:MAG: ORF6N domain-containing protein, partial [Flavobacteriales bacterium]
MENSLALTIENRIFMIRGKQVMLDTDLSDMFTIQVKRINEQVSRNSKRFPYDFSFQLSLDEWQVLKSQIATSTSSKGGKVKAPRVFTEHGIAMLAMLLRSELAVQMSIQIIQVFIQSRSTHAILQSIDHRMTLLEQENITTKSEIQTIWSAIRKNELPNYGIFFNNQIFDAYVFFSELIEHAETSIILIDNYIDHTVLLQLAKRKKNVTATIYTERIPAALSLDLEKHNMQYSPIEMHRIQHVHDRFLIIDEKELYHIGAS